MNSKPWYRQKKFWALGVIMMLVVGVGGLYLWQLVPSASYRELQRAVEREREARGVYTDMPEPSVSVQKRKQNYFMGNEPVDGDAALYSWASQFGSSDVLRWHFHPSIHEFERVYPYEGDLSKGDLSTLVRKESMRRQYFFEDFGVSVKDLDRWAEQYVAGKRNPDFNPSILVAWVVVRAILNENEDLALQVLDEFLKDSFEAPKFYGNLYSFDSSHGYNVSCLMIVLDHCRIDNPKIWTRIGVMLEKAEEKQRDFAVSFHEDLMRETEELLQQIQYDPPRIQQTPFDDFLNGFVVDAAQAIYLPIYQQKARNFAGYFSEGNFDEALNNLQAINDLQEKMFWKGNPGLYQFDRAHLIDFDDRDDQLAILELLRESRKSLMAISPREYATNVYRYLREGILVEGMELYELGTITPITMSYYRSEEYYKLFRGSQERFVSLEEIPDDPSYDGIREAFRKNLSEKLFPGVALVQKRDVPLHDPMVLSPFVRGNDHSDALKSVLLAKPNITLWYGELAIFPDLETIREKLVPEEAED